VTVGGYGGGSYVRAEVARLDVVVGGKSGFVGGGGGERREGNRRLSAESLVSLRIGVMVCYMSVGSGHGGGGFYCLAGFTGEGLLASLFRSIFQEQRDDA